MVGIVVVGQIPKLAIGFGDGLIRTDGRYRFENRVSQTTTYRRLW